MKRAVLTIVVPAIVAAAGCAGPPGADVDARPVVVAGERAVSRSELDDYLESHLPIDDEEGWEPEAVTAEVKSRLLDDLVREILLAEEAERSGIEVEPAEIDAWIAGGPEDRPASPAVDERRRRRARREILVQKLLESEARAASFVTEEDVDAYVSGAAGTGDPEEVRRAAREHLAQENSDRAVSALVDRVSSSVPRKVIPENLPFRYVAEPVESLVH